MGGQKSAGSIHNEAYAFLKKNYVPMLVITLVLYGVGLVLSTVMQFITAPILGFLGFFGSLTPLGMSQIREPADILPALIPMLGFLGFAALLGVATGLIEEVALDTAGVSAKNATLQLLSGVKPTFEGVWKNFAKNWKRYLGITAWSMLWTLLWGLLLIIPGYIKSLSYRFAPYLMIEYPEMTIKEALRKSIEITEGYKGRLFVLDLIMFGYYLAVAVLCCLVLPLLATIFWLPLLSYAMNGIAYLDIKQAAIEKGMLEHSVQPGATPIGK